MFPARWWLIVLMLEQLYGLVEMQRVTKVLLNKVSSNEVETACSHIHMELELQALKRVRLGDL